MGLDSLVRSAVAVADGLSASLQVAVSHEAYSAQDGFGKPTYAAAVSRQAVVSYTQKPIRTVEGQERMSAAQIVIPRNVTVDIRDRFTLPDGRTAPVLLVKGTADPVSGVYATEVWLG